MSLVGTRPPTVDEWKQYEPYHRGRLAVKPGLTGMWQVSGRSDITDFEEVVKLDMEYVKNDCLKKCIHVSILAYDHFLDDKECYRRIAFCDAKTGKEYTDLMEMHILELSKLPPEEKNETSLLQWMRFLGGKTRKDFEEMAKKNSELEEAYDVLDKLSADEKKRLEYETRQRAIRDYNIGMLTAERRGIEAGRKIGITEGENRINQLNIELSKLGRTADILKAAVDKEYQEKLLKEFEL